MDDIPSDYAHKRGVWSMSRPSVAMRYIKGRSEYEAAMRKWRAAEPYALIAEQIAATPKPATPEPPEWVQQAVQRDLRQSYVDIMERKGFKVEASEAPEWKGEPEQLVFVRAPERDLFVSDLITETINWYGTAGATDGDDLARAMSTPLPHDPDIRTRLMPWKGKDDGQ